MIAVTGIIPQVTVEGVVGRWIGGVGRAADRRNESQGELWPNGIWGGFFIFLCLLRRGTACLRPRAQAEGRVPRLRPEAASFAEGWIHCRFSLRREGHRLDDDAGIRERSPYAGGRDSYFYFSSTILAGRLRFRTNVQRVPTWTEAEALRLPETAYLKED